jgi:hypothetical protein
MATGHNLNVRWRQQPAHIARLQRYCFLRWIRARSAARSARWFAAVDRCAQSVGCALTKERPVFTSQASAIRLTAKNRSAPGSSRPSRFSRC